MNLIGLAGPMDVVYISLSLTCAVVLAIQDGF